MDVQQVSWAIKDPLNDKVTTIGSNALPNALTQAQLVQAMPHTFCLEINTNGDQRLCGAKILDQPMSLTCVDSNNQTYIVQPTPFEPVYFVNGHPTTVPIFRPK